MLGLPPLHRLAYELHLPGIRAREEREAALAAGKRPTPDQMYAWAIAEGATEDQAEAIAAKWAGQLLREGADGG
jgi:hypothetical protein